MPYNAADMKVAPVSASDTGCRGRVSALRALRNRYVKHQANQRKVYMHVVGEVHGQQGLTCEEHIESDAPVEIPAPLLASPAERTYPAPPNMALNAIRCIKFGRLGLRGTTEDARTVKCAHTMYDAL